MSEIKWVLVGTTGSGKTHIRVCFGKAAQKFKNALGEEPPALALQCELPTRIMDEVVGNKGNEEEPGTLVVRGRGHPFRLVDFKGGECDTFLHAPSEKWGKEIQDLMKDARLVVFVLTPDELGDADLLNAFQVLGNKVIREAAERGAPPPMLALAFSKSDDAGFSPPPEHRILKSTADQRLARQLGAGVTWEQFRTALAPDPADRTRVLLDGSRSFWEKLGPSAPVLNGYIVAATPEDPRWEGWAQRGVLQLAADFYDYAARTTPRFAPLTRWCATAAGLLIGATAVVFGVNEQRRATDYATAKALFGNGVSDVVLTKYHEQAENFGPRAALFGTDYPARQLVLRHVAAGYERLAGTLTGSSLFKFTENQSQIKVRTEREERAIKVDPVARAAWTEYRATLAGLAARGKQLHEFRERFSIQGDLQNANARKYLDELRQLASELNGVLEDTSRKLVTVRTARGDEPLSAVLTRAFQEALDEVLLATYKPAFVAALRDETGEGPLVLLGEKYNPYTARGLTSLGLRPPAGFAFRISPNPVRGVMICQDRFGAQFEVDLWHRTATNGGGPPSPLTDESVPGDAVLVEYRWPNGTATPTYQARPDKLLIATLVAASARGDGFDPAIHLNSKDPSAREQLRTGLSCLKFPRPEEQNPFAGSNAITRVLIDGIRAEKEQLRTDLENERTRGTNAKWQAVGLMVDKALSDLEIELLAQLPVHILTSAVKPADGLPVSLEVVCQKYLEEVKVPATDAQMLAHTVIERYLECHRARKKWRVATHPREIMEWLPELPANPRDWEVVEHQVDLAVRLEGANRRYARYRALFERSSLGPQLPDWLTLVKTHQEAKTLAARLAALRATATAAAKLSGDLLWVVSDANALAIEYEQIKDRYGQTLSLWAEPEPDGKREWTVRLPKGYDVAAKAILDPPPPAPVQSDPPKGQPVPAGAGK